MKKYETDSEYLSIIEDILNNEDFNIMGSTKHHNTTRLNHMLKVSYKSYKISKKLKLDYKSTARAALLHDFYLEQVNDCNQIKDKVTLFTGHSMRAIDNAKKITNLNKKEEDIIKTHMFPVYYKVPKYKESWLVSLIDKYFSIGEFYDLYSTKLALLANLFLIFLIKR